MRRRAYISLFHTDSTEIKIPFDYISNISVSLNLNVNTITVARGKNKTFNAYKEPTKITISGKFSERTVDNLININFSEDPSVRYLNFSSNKIVYIRQLFLSFLQDVRLFYIYTGYKTYKNYILTEYSVANSNSFSSVNISLTFQEVLFRNNSDLYADKILLSSIIEELSFPPLSESTLKKQLNSQYGNKEGLERYIQVLKDQIEERYRIESNTFFNRAKSSLKNKYIVIIDEINNILKLNINPSFKNTISSLDFKPSKELLEKIEDLKTLQRHLENWDYL